MIFMVKLTEHEKNQKKQEETKKKKEETEKKTEKVDMSIEDLEKILYPLVTEKAVNMIDTENKITFIVSDKTDKKEIKRIIEDSYKIKIEKINIVRDRKGRKKAIVKLKKEFKAQDVATKLGVL